MLRAKHPHATGRARGGGEEAVSVSEHGCSTRKDYQRESKIEDKQPRNGRGQKPKGWAKQPAGWIILCSQRTMHVNLLWPPKKWHEGLL